MSIRFFNEISSENVGLAGGKGASLGELTRAGIRVPRGFVVLSTVFDDFLDQSGLGRRIEQRLHGLDHEDSSATGLASRDIVSWIEGEEVASDVVEEICDAFERLGVPSVAVRSSATAEDSVSAAWAGQLETYLNTTEDQLVANVRRCWASLFTPRAIFYRFEQGLHGKRISVAVVVQTMVNSEVSGTAFSVHPVTRDGNHILIEAGHGLGEAVVSGAITPDGYVVEKSSCSIVERVLGGQTRQLVRAEGSGTEWVDVGRGMQGLQILSDAKIAELAKVIRRIEKHYELPQDIEWAIEDDVICITQSRPITTL